MGRKERGTSGRRNGARRVRCCEESTLAVVHLPHSQEVIRKGVGGTAEGAVGHVAPGVVAAAIGCGLAGVVGVFQVSIRS